MELSFALCKAFLGTRLCGMYDLVGTLKKYIMEVSSDTG